MSVGQPDTFDQELIDATRLVAESAASRMATLTVGSSARMLRPLFPTARSLVVRTGRLSHSAAVDVKLIEIVDDDGDPLWSAMTGVVPRAPGTHGGWNTLCAAVQARLAEALAHATPTYCGWRPHHVEADTDDPQHLPKDGDLYLVKLPAVTETGTADVTKPPANA